nr:hypothetical protein [Quisquiliibacterium sp.]
MPVDVAGAPGVEVVPADVIAGLGACDRDALATGLALLEDAALRTHCRAASRRRADPFGFDAPAHGEAAVVDG